MSDSPTTERHAYDVLVVGAGGAGLRAAIAAHDAGAQVAIVCKSLLGKAHTVMAEGGAAAAMGNLYPEDNWQVHFRDTMRGGKMLNHWRMAQLHAQEAPDRIYELEEWGALFDRTPDGLISQRDFGGHRYARLAHVGDRTGLELIRTLQERAVALGIDVYMECTVTRLLQDGGRIAGAFAYWRESGRFVLFESPTVILATGGIGKSYKVTSNSWEYTGDGHALALEAGASLVNMEFVQFHPTGMVWPPSVRGILVTESVRGDGGVLRNSEGKRFMFDYIPEFFKTETGRLRGGGRPLVRRQEDQPPPARAAPRDEVARAINAEVKSGRGSPHGGVFLDIASRRTPDYIQSELPSMYHQFKELADVDITAEAMEVGPTCHYVMGGVAVDARHRRVVRARPLCSRRGRRRNAWRQPARGQLAVGPAGVRPAGGSQRRVRRRPDAYASVGVRRRRARRSRRSTGTLCRGGGENPYTVPARPPGGHAHSGRNHPHSRRDGAGAQGDRRTARTSSEGHR